MRNERRTTSNGTAESPQGEAATSAAGTSVGGGGSGGGASGAGQAPAAVAEAGKRYACAACPYATDRRDLFTRHENIHRDEKPFHCYLCQKQFNRADHVKKHFLRMHRDQPYDLNRIRRSNPKPQLQAQTHHQPALHHYAKPSPEPPPAPAAVPAPPAPEYRPPPPVIKLERAPLAKQEPGVTPTQHKPSAAPTPATTASGSSGGVAGAAVTRRKVRCGYPSRSVFAVGS